MRLKNIVFMVGVLVFILSGPAASQQWVDIKDPNELRTLHSNKTHRWISSFEPFVEHYRADGKGILIYSSADKRQTPCTWEVKGNDQVCVSSEILSGCWQFQHSKKNPEEYVKRMLSEDKPFMVILKVEDGIPQF